MKVNFDDLNFDDLNFDDLNFDDDGTQLCPKCRGAGLVDYDGLGDHEPCHVCGGTGAVFFLK